MVLKGDWDRAKFQPRRACVERGKGKAWRGRGARGMEKPSPHMDQL